LQLKIKPSQLGAP